VTYSKADLSAATMALQLENVADDPDLPLDLLIALAELRGAYQWAAEAQL
jgi:hypothetical protein